MKTISFDEIKEIQLDILICVDKFCRDNNINYSLAYGTLIGAIRHNGYIPWDDDIDIMMSRNDYNRFLKAFNGTFKHLSLLSPELNWDYYAPYANVYDNRTLLKEGSNGHRGMNIGVKIDIFPMDIVAEEYEEYKKQLETNRDLNSKLYVKRTKVWKIIFKHPITGLKIIIKKILYAFRSYSSIQKQIASIGTRYTCSNYIDCIVFPEIQDTRIDKSIFYEYVDAPFERMNAQIIKHYDVYLSKIYGDYMQLPPEENRILHHDFEAYWID
ncbi:MAG: LicD family protein [Flavobacteriales bacterium]|nr:LicD family protein [Flavobacteriales bacterium]